MSSNLADDVRAGFYDAWRGSSGVHATDVGAAVRRFDALNADDSARFRAILEDPDLRNSWVRVAGAKNIDRSDIETALDRIEVNSQHSVVDFDVGRFANPADAEHPPHDPHSIVVEMELEEGDEFWRVYERNPGAPNPDENLDGKFLTRRATLETADSSEEVLNELGLLRSEFQNYNYVGRVEVTDEFVENHQIRVQVSTTRRQVSDVSDEVRPGGGTQYILEDDLLPTDQGVNWEPVDDLGDFVD